MQREAGGELGGEQGAGGASRRTRPAKSGRPTDRPANRTPSSLGWGQTLQVVSFGYQAAARL